MHQISSTLAVSNVAINIAKHCKTFNIHGNIDTILNSANLNPWNRYSEMLFTDPIAFIGAG